MRVCQKSLHGPNIRKALEGNQEDLKILIMLCYGFKKSIWLKVINIICVSQLLGSGAHANKGTCVSRRDSESRLHLISHRMNYCKSYPFMLQEFFGNSSLIMNLSLEGVEEDEGGPVGHVG